MSMKHTAALAVLLLTAAAYPAEEALAQTSPNLLVDGGGESGACTADFEAVTTVPGWTVLYGSPSVVCYSSAQFSTPSSPASGNGFIAAGPYGNAAITQTVNVSADGAAIDGGGVSFTLSGWLGGWGSYGAYTQLSATFLSASGQPLGASAQVPTVSASQRGNANAFLARSTTGKLPVGTRSIQVLVQFLGTPVDSYNDSYADNLSLTLSAPLSAPALATPVSTVPAYDHVFVVQMENTNFSQVIGDTSDAPFINGLANRGTLLTNYSGTYHPSDENYLAIAGGSDFVEGAVYWPNIKVASPHLGDSLEAIGKTWKAYEQGMGTPCNLATQYDSYYEPDDAPFINFTDISSNTARCQAHLFDTTQLTTDLQSAATTPNFAWLAADDYNDGEASGDGSSTSLQVQDAWLKQTLQPIFSSPAWTGQRSLLVLTWDESDDPLALPEEGNHIATILVDSQGLVRPGYGSGVSYNHFNTGATIERALGLPTLTANDGYAAPINDAFAAPTSPAASPVFNSSTAELAEGGNIVFNYATPSAQFSTSNWVGIYKAGDTPGVNSSDVWQYVPTANGNVALSTAGLSPGNYTAYYFSNGGYTRLGSPINFTVTP